jgi:hypothetical protein
VLTVFRVRGIITASAFATLVCFARPSWSAWTSDPTVNLPVCALAAQQQWPKLATDYAGGAIITWQDARAGSTNNDIYTQHVTASGTVDAAWPVNGRVICAAAGQQMFPAITSDGAGGAIVCWQDGRSGTGNDIYAQHIRANGTVDPLWPADGRLVGAGVGSQPSPVILSDGLGGAIAAWQDQRSGNFDIYAQHILAGGTLDAAWPANGLAVCSAVGNQLSPRLVPDNAGTGVLVSWQDQRSGDFDIYAQHVRANGTVDPAWPVDGRGLCIAANAQQAPMIASDGTGGAVVTWQDFRNGVDYDIYAQHVQSSGVVDPGWPLNGRLLAVNASDQYSPTIVSDGAGGGVVAWEDVRNSATTDWDIYAMRVLANGTLDPAWPANGRPLCQAVGRQENLVATSDKAGGMIAVWQDERVGYDIYAQHVSVSGVVDAAWPVDGRAISTATNDQITPMVVPDGVAGAIVTWQDQRNGSDLDIYAQRVQANGQLGGDVVGVGPTSGPLSLAPIYPNPARGHLPTVSFALETGEPAMLEWVDVTGRRVATEEVGRLGPGVHSVTLGAGQRLKPGLYWLRLRQGTELVQRRVVLLD